jgi:hypothetical protein
MSNSSEPGLLQDGQVSSAGTSLSPAEIEALVAERFPRKAYCRVEDWLIFHVDEPAESLARVRATGLEPIFMYAHCVIYDGHGRFPPGGWVRSTLCKSFDGVCLFETRNTIYVLVGHENLPDDHTHLDGQNGVDHEHPYVIDDQYRRWPNG